MNLFEAACRPARRTRPDQPRPGHRTPTAPRPPADRQPDPRQEPWTSRRTVSGRKPTPATSPKIRTPPAPAENDHLNSRGGSRLRGFAPPNPAQLAPVPRSVLGLHPRQRGRHARRLLLRAGPLPSPGARPRRPAARAEAEVQRDLRQVPALLRIPLRGQLVPVNRRIVFAFARLDSRSLGESLRTFRARQARGHARAQTPRTALGLAVVTCLREE